MLMTAGGRLPASLLRLKERHRQLTTGRQDIHTVMNYHFSMTVLDGIQLLHLKRWYVLHRLTYSLELPLFQCMCHIPNGLCCVVRVIIYTI